QRASRTTSAQAGPEGLQMEVKPVLGSGLQVTRGACTKTSIGFRPKRIEPALLRFLEHLPSWFSPEIDDSRLMRQYQSPPSLYSPPLEEIFEPDKFLRGR